MSEAELQMLSLLLHNKVEKLRIFLWLTMHNAFLSWVSA